MLQLAARTTLLKNDVNAKTTETTAENNNILARLDSWGIESRCRLSTKWVQRVGGGRMADTNTNTK